MTTNLTIQQAPRLPPPPPDQFGFEYRDGSGNIHARGRARVYSHLWYEADEYRSFAMHISYKFESRNMYSISLALDIRRALLINPNLQHPWVARLDEWLRHNDKFLSTLPDGCFDSIDKIVRMIHAIRAVGFKEMEHIIKHRFRNATENFFEF